MSFNLEAACAAAKKRIQKHINATAGQHLRAIRAGFKKAGAEFEPVTATVQAEPQQRLCLASEGTESARRINRGASLKALAAAAALVTLAGCGGGGSTVPASAPGQPVPVIRVAAYGDSTQAEQGNPHAATRPGFLIENKGVGGTNSETLVPGWPGEMAASAAAVVVINHGINDRDLIRYRENLRQLVTQAQAAGKRVMLEMPNQAGDVQTPLMAAIGFDVPAFEARRAAMRDVAQSMGVYLCDQARVPLRDGIHPTPEGYAIKAQRLARCIAEVAA